MLVSISYAIQPVGRYTTLCDAWPVRHQTYGYLPGQTALPLPFGRYLLLILLRVEGWVGLDAWLYRFCVYADLCIGALSGVVIDE